MAMGSAGYEIGFANGRCEITNVSTRILMLALSYEPKESESGLGSEEITLGTGDTYTCRPVDGTLMSVTEFSGREIVTHEWESPEIDLSGVAESYYQGKSTWTKNQDAATWGNRSPWWVEGAKSRTLQIDGFMVAASRNGGTAQDVQIYFDDTPIEVSSYPDEPDEPHVFTLTASDDSYDSDYDVPLGGWKLDVTLTADGEWFVSDDGPVFISTPIITMTAYNPDDIGAAANFGYITYTDLVIRHTWTEDGGMIDPKTLWYRVPSADSGWGSDDERYLFWGWVERESDSTKWPSSWRGAATIGR